MGSSSWRLDPVSWLDFQSYFTATITMMFAALAQLAILATIWQTGEAKFWKTKFSDCGSILNIADAITGSVTMTAPFNRKTGRHVLGKGKEVEICIEGTLSPNSGLSPPFAGLKNQAHGKLEVAGVTVPVLVENNFQDRCETEFDVGTLRRAGKPALVCINIPARVQVPRG